MEPGKEAPMPILEITQRIDARGLSWPMPIVSTALDGAVYPFVIRRN